MPAYQQKYSYKFLFLKCVQGESSSQTNQYQISDREDKRSSSSRVSSGTSQPIVAKL